MLPKAGCTLASSQAFSASGAQQAQSALGQGVVGRALVRRQADRGGKGRRHTATVGGHMAHLACGQPELDQQGAQQGDGEQDREWQRRHGAQCRGGQPRAARAATITA
jgi:hypothetical protein